LKFKKKERRKKERKKERKKVPSIAYWLIWEVSSTTGALFSFFASFQITKKKKLWNKLDWYKKRKKRIVPSQTSFQLLIKITACSFITLIDRWIICGCLKLVPAIFLFLAHIGPFLF